MDYDLIFRKDARNAVLHNEGRAAVAAVRRMPDHQPDKRDFLGKSVI